MEAIRKIARKKTRRILSLSAAHAHSGMYCLYVEVQRGDWRVIHHQVVPYTQKIRPLIEKTLAAGGDSAIALRDLAALDQEFSIFALECVRSFLASVVRTAAVPDLVVFDRLALWRGAGATGQFHSWNLHIGEPQLIASALNVPVLTDFIRHDILSGGPGVLPIVPGELDIARRAGDIAVLVNIGMVSHMTIIDSVRQEVLVRSDTGPGTYLINEAARRAGCAEGFDRDGFSGAAGSVDVEVLEELSSSEWFEAPAPKTAYQGQFDDLLNRPSLWSLAPADALATITALTARTVFNFFKKNWPLKQMPPAVWISGGGTDNQGLVEYLTAYFSPVAVKSVEELEIPPRFCFPLAVALTVDAYIDGRQAKVTAPSINVPPGKWVLP